MNRTHLAIVLALALAPLGCGKDKPIAKDEAGAQPAIEDPRAPSLYDLPVTLTDQSGKKLTLRDLAGHPVLITMFYGTCPHACPMLISDVKAIERQLDPETRAALRVVLVSFDPARDTTEALKELADKHHVDQQRWLFANATDEDVRTLAAGLGIKYRRLPDGSYNHSSIITLLDARGGVASKVDGLQQPSDALRTRASRIARR